MLSWFSPGRRPAADPSSSGVGGAGGPMPLDEIITIAQSTPEELAATKRLKADGKLTEEELRKNNGYDKRTPQEIAKERASFLLDLVIAAPEAYSYAACRQELAELYTEAEEASLAAFVCPEAKP